jgi:molecular chaperone GrpE
MSKRREGETLEADDADAKIGGNGEAEEPTGLEAVEPAGPKDEYEALKRERDELKDQVLRRRADFENYRKRVERDREQAVIEARAQVLAGLLPTIDNFERALAAPASGDDSTLRAGVELIYRNLMSFLEQQGVVVKDPTGERFDPQIHQALSAEPVPGADDGTIVETFRKAYFLRDRLLRPALVKVAQGSDGDLPDSDTH